VDIVTAHGPVSATRDLFLQGNYAAVALADEPDQWETYAALGLVGKTREALAGLERFPGDGPAFYAAVARWIDGDDAGACSVLQRLPGEHARNLLRLIEKPRLRVLAQLPWTRSGCSDLVSHLRKDHKFKLDNVSFHPADRANAPYLDVHSLFDANEPPDFYVCQMVEWHLVPPNLMALPCPVIGQTADYDLHIQAVHPWLQLFDELVVTDPSEWDDVRRLAAVPVSTFPRSFGLPEGLPPVPRGRRDWDLFLSGTVTHAYHPDKARLLHQLLAVPDARLKLVNGFRPADNYLRNLASSRVCVTYVRHPTATPTRGLEALAMGCALVVQRGSVLTLYCGEAEGVHTYDLDAGDLTATVRRLLDRWPEQQRRAERGAEVVRREFALSRVASQYLRFLTFLAARPRRRPTARYADGLVQKRVVVQAGWLPDYDFDHSLILKRIGLETTSRLAREIDAGPTTPQPYIDSARESVLYNFHRARNHLAPVGEWLATVSQTYRRGLEAFPRSLALRLNCARVLLHFGYHAEQKYAIDLIDETLRRPAEEWALDVMDDVFPWDFYPQLFNYRSYFDLVTRYLTHGDDVLPQLRRLVYASMYYYRGFFAPYQGYHSAGLEHFRRAADLDPEFPYYCYHLARELLQRGLPEDDAEAIGLLAGLARQSILFLDAFELLERLAAGRRPRLRTPEIGPDEPTETELPQLPPAPTVADDLQLLLAELGPAARRACSQIDFVEPITPELNRKALLRPEAAPEMPVSVVPMVREMDKLRERLRKMESTKFWQLRKAWFRIKRMFGLGGNE
jgi:hypothetical protein